MTNLIEHKRKTAGAETPMHSFTARIPLALYAEFKLWCAVNSKSQQDATEAALRALMARNESEKMRLKFPLLSASPAESSLLLEALELLRSAPDETRQFFTKFISRWKKLG
jgi:hypothetical protein